MGERIVISILLGSYGYTTDVRPATFQHRHVEDGAEEPFETSTSTAEGATKFYEKTTVARTLNRRYRRR